MIRARDGGVVDQRDGRQSPRATEIDGDRSGAQPREAVGECAGGNVLLKRVGLPRHAAIGRDESRISAGIDAADAVGRREEEQRAGTRRISARRKPGGADDIDVEPGAPDVGELGMTSG